MRRTALQARRPARFGRDARAWLAGVAVLAACASPPPPPLGGQDYVYHVGAGDVLSVEVWNEPGLEQREITVTPDGFIAYPLIDAPIEVSGRTIGKIAEKLRDELLAVLTEPMVTVALVESRSSQVQVLGEVTKQGRVAYRDQLSLIEAITEAGGLGWKEAKLEAVHVVRGALTDPQLIEVDLSELLMAEAKDVVLEPGDIVVVPAKWVTRYSRYMTQLLAPVAVAVGAAGTAAIIGVGTPGN